MYSVHGCDLCGWPCIYIHTWYICVLSVHVFTGSTCSASQLIGPGAMGLLHPHLSWAVRSGPMLSLNITIMSSSVCNFCISYLSTDFLTGLSQYSELRLCICAMSEVGLGSSQAAAKPLGGREFAARITESRFQ